MEQYLTTHEIHITWLLFVSAFTVIGLAETFRPRKAVTVSTARRWLTNALLSAGNIAVEVLYPLGGTAVALMVAKSPYGLLNRSAIPFALRCAVGVVVLDLVRYGVHYLFHRSALLWRVHRVHHSDRDFDLTTGVRNHPVEVAIVQLFELAAVALIAPPAAAVVILGIITAAQNLLSHANLQLPELWDQIARPLLITPDMHRVHHSERFAEQNANFGILFSFWDRLFGTYRASPADGHEGMRLGLEELRDSRTENALYLLALPFRPLPAQEPVRAPAEPQRHSA